MLLVAAPDKFKGTVSAAAAAQAMAKGAYAAGWEAVECPLADGGEGTLDAFGGANRDLLVTGPLGEPVVAGWRLDEELGVIEMASASGLVLAGGREGNDPLKATTRGTGELIAEAIRSGARHLIVGVGGSATTDGGLGAIEALGSRSFAEEGVTVEVACDVETPFLDAARLFGPQKGADEPTVTALSGRLQLLADRYRAEYGVDVTSVRRGGAAGGLAGALLALGAHLESGFEVIARAVALEGALEGADLVVTGEGRLDATSFAGKVVGGVQRLALPRGLSVLVIAGEANADATQDLEVISLSERFGTALALNETASCIEAALRDWLSERA
jgi:glycerate kinase